MRAQGALVAAAIIVATRVDPAVGAPIEQRVWIVHGSDPRVLEHAIRETDDRDFFASCRPHSGTMRVVLTQTITGLDRRSRVAVTIAAGSWQQRYAATTIMDDESGAFVPVLTVAASGGLLRAMAREHSLRITVGGRAVAVVTLTGSAATVRAFAASCGSGARFVGVAPHALERQAPRVRRDELMYRLGPPRTRLVETHRRRGFE
jgi:hypothetical protein